MLQAAGKEASPMQLTRPQQSWDPMQELEDISQRFRRVFGFTRSAGNGEREALAIADWYPSCDISETDKEYRIQAELPNMKKDDIQVALADGVLTIQGERREQKEERGVRFHRRELSYGHFVRRFTMPEDADDSKVDATFKDGMLDVVIPKSKATPPKAKQIAVH
jgi:HSP20 family protein